MYADYTNVKCPNTPRSAHVVVLSMHLDQLPHDGALMRGEARRLGLALLALQIAASTQLCTAQHSMASLEEFDEARIVESSL